ncbi:MAG: porin [Pseudomonadota bacterium]|nr:porin [Pseudomonadota bacterium]
MKHSTLAFAWLAAAAAMPAAAQAQSGITVYGLLDVGLRNDSNVLPGKSKFQEISGMTNTSRWGFRGSEDLGNGLKANFNLEGGINPDTGTQNEAASLFDRRATVGLSGAWGKLDMGRDQTFSWQYTLVYDPLGGALATPTPTSHTSGKAALLVNGFMFVKNNPYNNAKLRDNNIKYIYTDSSGFVAGLDYSAGEVAGDRRKRSGRQAMLGYMKGNLNAIAAFDVLRDAANLEQKVIVAGGNYRFDNAARVIVGYAVMTAAAGFSATSNVVSGPIANYSSTFGVAANGNIRVATSAAGADFPVAPATTLNASFYNTRVSGDGIAANRYNTYALMAKYALSKRTTLYAIVDHETATENGGLATVSGSRTNTGITAGMQMRF